LNWCCMSLEEKTHNKLLAKWSVAKHAWRPSEYPLLRSVSKTIQGVEKLLRTIF
jgi:hypothetical protein